MEPYYAIVYIALIFASAQHGTGREIGWWRTFLLSLIFSPIVGVVAATASARIDHNQKSAWTSPLIRK